MEATAFEVRNFAETEAEGCFFRSKVELEEGEGHRRSSKDHFHYKGLSQRPLKALSYPYLCEKRSARIDRESFGNDQGRVHLKFYHVHFMSVDHPHFLKVHKKQNINNELQFFAPHYKDDELCFFLQNNINLKCKVIKMKNQSLSTTAKKTFQWQQMKSMMLLLPSTELQMNLQQLSKTFAVALTHGQTFWLPKKLHWWNRNWRKKRVMLF